MRTTGIWVIMLLVGGFNLGLLAEGAGFPGQGPRGGMLSRFGEEAPGGRAVATVNYFGDDGKPATIAGDE